MAAPSRYRRSYRDVAEQREAYEEQRRKKRARRRTQQVKAHKRRLAGKIVHVRGYCRRRGRSQAQIKREMPF